MITISNYYKWYFIPKVKFNIIKYTKNRESALISTLNNFITLRMLKIHNVQHIDFHLKAINWYKNKWNFYYSLAEYENGIPNQKFNLRKRDNSDWKENHWKEMVAYDFLIDIDASDHSEINHAQISALNVVERLSRHKIPFSIRFSGCGFHIVIPYSYFKDKNYSFLHGSDDSIYPVYKSIAGIFNNEVSEMVDTKIYDHRRLIKVPYSLALYKDDIYVCMPISIEKLKNFNLSDYLPKNAIKCLE